MKIKTLLCSIALTALLASCTTVQYQYSEARIADANTDVFVIYLPEDVAEDTLKLEKFRHIVADINEAGGKMLLIGESRFHRELLMFVPVIKNNIWLDRPVEMEVLQPAIEKAFTSATGGAKKNGSRMSIRSIL